MLSAHAEAADQSKQRTILTVEDLTVVRGGRRILEDLSVSFGPGITAILGPNGAGKTTLLEGILEAPFDHAARLTLDGENVDAGAASRQFFGRVGFMPQHWQFTRSFTARESVEYAAWVKGIPSRRLSIAASTALERVGLLAEANRKVRTLSGGMRQRVGLAEAFVNEPRAILLDEPTVGLDPAQRADFRRFLRANAADRSIVLSTHLTDDVDALADRVIVLTGTGIAFDGSVTSLGEFADGQEGAANKTEAGYLSIVQHPSTSSGTTAR